QELCACLSAGETALGRKQRAPPTGRFWPAISTRWQRIGANAVASQTAAGCQPSAQLFKETMMRTVYAFGLAAFLAGSPAMAQVIIGGGDNDAARHEAQAQQDRADAHQDMNQARRDAAMGNYGAAAQEQHDARSDWRQAHHQQH